jgi:DNA-directed DNA polymerase III PolC
MYVSLHNRSAYSFNTSLIHPDQLVDAAAGYGMSAIALTDLNGLYGAVGFQQACQRSGIKPILGVETELAEGIEVTLLARGETGYRQLCRVVSRRHLEGRALTLDEVTPMSGDLICLLGTIPHQALEAILRLFRDRFADRLYVELRLHGGSDAVEARRRARAADDCTVAVVASCAARCLQRHQAATLQALSAIGTLTLLDEPHPAKPHGAYHLRCPAEMDHLFRRRPDAIYHTELIAEQCGLSLDLTRQRFPAFCSSDGRPAIAHLTDLATAGCTRRYVTEPQQRGIGGRRPTLQQALERLHRELSVIDQVHYAEYFLVFHDIVQYCRESGISSLARGSAADSLVCYALGVSHACPFRFDLPFDRFINPERAKFSKMADIDLDLPWDRRDQVIRWVYDRYGHDRVAMIGSANTYRARGAVAELGKTYGLAPSEIHTATKLLSSRSAINLPRTIASNPESRHLPIHEEPYRTILQLARHLQGLPHHWSMHPCGLVVSPEPLTELVPVQRSPKGQLVAQYDMDAIEDLGFVKVDLLGQAGLSVLRDSVAEIRRTTGADVDIDRDVDFAESATWDMIAAGGARGVHHIESPAMTSLITQCHCRDIDCLTTVVAIIRPGAANQGKKEAFARRHQGLEPPQFAHPTLQSALSRTYGLMVFEEHILQIAVDFAGMNLGRADVLRRALNKQNMPLIRRLEAEFRDAAARRGRTPEEIESVWPLVEGFAGFMFNKAHSAEYAIEAFQGAWLKRRWPVHYLAAVLSNYRGFYAHSPTLPQILYVLEALRLGARFRGPCVQRSSLRFTVDYEQDGNPAIRVPIPHIQSLTQTFTERWHDARRSAPFKTVDDFFARCRPTASEARVLLDSGALDALDSARPRLFWTLQRLTRQFATSDSLFQKPGVLDDRAPLEFTAPDRQQVAQLEMDLLGFPIAIHPLDYLGSQGRDYSIDWTRFVQLNRLHEHLERRVEVCGMMVADRTNTTGRGELMKFVTLGDRTGFVETILFPDVYRRDGHLLAGQPILAATAIVEPFENRRGFTLRVEQLRTP